MVTLWTWGPQGRNHSQDTYYNFLVRRNMGRALFARGYLLHSASPYYLSTDVTASVEGLPTTSEVANERKK